MTAMKKPPSSVVTLPDAVKMPAYDVRELVHENGQAHLLLDGATYTLRITRAGKLILTK